MSGPPRLIVPVTDIRRHLGTRKDVFRELEAQGLGLPDVRVPDGAMVTFDGNVESISDGVVLTGEVTVPWQGTCRRCLDETDGIATADVREVYEVHPTDGDTWPLENDQIDLGPLLRDTALLSLPLAPLCDVDCLGPAPESFPTGIEVPEDPDDEPVVDDGPPRDPRWAALDGLDFD